MCIRDSRDTEQKLIRKLKNLQKEWQVDEASNPIRITEDSIADVVSMVTRIPVRKVAESEGQKLLKMKAEMSESIVGQERAIESLSKAIQRSRAGLKRQDRPIGVFLFLGPTGVGKTETAKVLANYLFSYGESLIKLDMSEYGERFSVSRLIGAPPGYVGYEEGGELTEKVRRNPYSVILFDEIEKAHPDVFNVLLQLFDEGVLTDGLGRKVDFRNTIIILTSNISSRMLEKGTSLGFHKDDKELNYDKMQKELKQDLKKTFNPEFLNRLSETVVFRPLELNNIVEILDVQLQALNEQLIQQGLTLDVTSGAKQWIAEKGFDANFGARPLKRAIQKYLEDVLSDEMLKGRFKNGGLIEVSLQDDSLVFVEKADAVKVG